MKKILPLLLALCMLLPAFSGCGNVRSLTIVKDGTCTLVYDSDTVSSGTLRAVTNALEEATGNTVTATTDLTFDKGAILLGNVILPDGTRAAGDLRSKDYKVGIQSKYYLIGGVTQSMTADAADYFIENVLPLLKNGKLKVAAKNDALNLGQYQIDSAALNDMALGHYSIVLPKEPTVSELRTAVQLKEHLASSFGYVLAITDAERAKTTGQIRVGKGLCETAKAENAHDYAVSVKGAVMEIAAESYLGYTAALKQLTKTVFNPKTESLAIDDSASCSGNGATLSSAPLTHSSDVRIMFSNIHGQPADGNVPMPVEQPTQMLTELFLEYLPDVLGLQECTSHSYKAGIVDMLSSEYESINGNSTYHTALFYRKSTVECLGSGHFAFDKISNEEYSGTRKNDASKGVTWGIFKVKATGKIFMVGSTHLWWQHKDPANDEAWRAAQMTKLKSELITSANAYEADNGLAANSIPIFVGGDYNTRYKLDYTMLDYAVAPFVNANDLAPSAAKLTKTTIHGYATYNQETGIYDTPVYSNAGYDAALDHIFTNGTGVTVDRVGILTDLYAYLSSDHNPIYTDFSFK